MYKEIGKEKTSKTEKEILNYWESIDILNLTIENRKDNEDFVFYDGPAYANGYPGLHHMMAKFLKDSNEKQDQLKKKDPKGGFSSKNRR